MHRSFWSLNFHEALSLFQNLVVGFFFMFLFLVVNQILEDILTENIEIVVHRYFEYDLVEFTNASLIDFYQVDRILVSRDSLKYSEFELFPELCFRDLQE